MEKISIDQLQPFINAAFENGKTFKIPVTGQSMLPLLVQGRDYAIIKKQESHLNVGDVPLYRRNNGVYVLHRVVGFDGDGYIMCGDNQIELEHGITDKNVVGVVCEFLIDGKTVDVSADKEYLEYKQKYVDNIKSRYPAKRIRSLLSGIKHKILK